jgi:hypothetical protein
LAWSKLDIYYLGSIKWILFNFCNPNKKKRDKFDELIGLNKFPKLKSFLQILTTFALSCFAWIFFRANNLKDALNIIKRIFTVKGPLSYENSSILIFAFFGILFLLAVELKKEYHRGNFSFTHNKSWLVRNFTYATLIILILLIGVLDGGQFIYFQF